MQRVAASPVRCFRVADSKSNKPGRSGNPAKREESGGKAKIDRKTPVKPKPIGNRWAAPAMISCALIGLAWIVVFYVFQGVDVTIPVFSDLGNWNLVVGMGFIVAAFGFSMKWE